MVVRVCLKCTLACYVPRYARVMPSVKGKGPFARRAYSRTDMSRFNDGNTATPLVAV